MSVLYFFLIMIVCLLKEVSVVVVAPMEVQCCNSGWNVRLASTWVDLGFETSKKLSMRHNASGMSSRAICILFEI